MFEKEIILEEQLAARCLFQCSVAGKLPANGGLAHPFLVSSLLHEVHVTVPLKEFEITDPVKIILGAQFHFRVLDDLG